MSTFKTALRMALAHPFYLLIYTVFISLMGVFIAASVSWNSSQLTEYKPYDANVIVVDRDGSDLSRALTKHLGSRFDLVTGVGDDTYDLADALSKSNSAKGSADCVFFIPEGFEDDLVAAARAGESLPKLDVTYGAGTMAAALSSAEASRWISLAGAAAALEPTASNGDVAKAAEHAAAKRAEVQIERVKVDSAAAATLESYFNFGAYAIISSVIVSVGLVFSGMNEPERVRRMDAGPISERQRSLAVFAAAVLTVCIWFVSSMMGVVGFAGAVAEVGVGRVCLALAATFALACTPLAVGFTLSSLGAREELLNGVGNLLGMLMTFLGGAWMPLSLMGSAVQTVAHFVPTYWVNDAISKALASDLTSTVLGDIACDLGVTALFAVAIAAAGLALARTKSHA
ncbi:ABC transporter permease [Collinsella aerofaciens]|uniref:ABC transporter permease n=1 Tax=Collinsella aerofaciens TaxID=74426 RepID=UPI00321A75AE